METAWRYCLAKKQRTSKTSAFDNEKQYKVPIGTVLWEKITLLNAIKSKPILYLCFKFFDFCWLLTIVDFSNLTLEDQLLRLAVNHIVNPVYFFNLREKKTSNFITKFFIITNFLGLNSQTHLEFPKLHT